MDQWLQEVEDSGKRLLILEIGAGRAITTIRSRSEQEKKRFPSAKLVRINLEDSVDADLSIPMEAKHALIRLKELLNKL